MSNENGLVTIKFLKCLGAYMPGDIAGFTPDAAQSLIKKGIAADTDATETASDPDSGPGGNGEISGGAITSTASNVGGTPIIDPGSVKIPDGWMELHHFKLINIAKHLSPDAKNVDKDVAIAIINTEIERRKANEQ